MAVSSSLPPPPATGTGLSTFFNFFPFVMLANRSPRTEAPPTPDGAAGSGGGGGAFPIDGIGGGMGGGSGGWPNCEASCTGGSWGRICGQKGKRFANGKCS